MAIYVRPFVTSSAHVEGCPRRNCGPGCARETDGWEYHIKLVLPNGESFEERRKSPLSGKASTQRYAEERVHLHGPARDAVEDADLPDTKSVLGS